MNEKEIKKIYATIEEKGDIECTLCILSSKNKICDDNLKCKKKCVFCISFFEKFGQKISKLYVLSFSDIPNSQHNREDFQWFNLSSSEIYIYLYVYYIMCKLTFRRERMLYTGISRWCFLLIRFLSRNCGSLARFIWTLRFSTFIKEFQKKILSEKIDCFEFRFFLFQTKEIDQRRSFSVFNSIISLYVTI